MTRLRKIASIIYTVITTTLSLEILIYWFLLRGSAFGMNLSGGSIGIIGGADGPTAQYITQTLIYELFTSRLFPIIFSVLSILINVFGIRLAYKENTKLKPNLFLSGGVLLNLICYLCVHSNVWSLVHYVALKFAIDNAWIYKIPKAIHIALITVSIIYAIIIIICSKKPEKI